VAGVAFEAEAVSDGMFSGTDRVEKKRESAVDVVLATKIHDGGSADFAEQASGVTGLCGQREDRTLYAQILICFSGDLMVTIGSLEKQEGIGVGAFLQGLMVRNVGLQMDDIRDIHFAENDVIEILRAWGAERDLEILFADATLGLKARDGAKEGAGIALVRIEGASM